jgi:hypothetical protein
MITMDRLVTTAIIVARAPLILSYGMPVQVLRFSFPLSVHLLSISLRDMENTLPYLQISLSAVREVVLLAVFSQ